MSFNSSDQATTLAGMDAPTAAIVGAAIGGLTGGGAQVLMWHITRRSDARAARLRLLDDAMGRLSTHRRLISEGWAMWRQGVPVAQESAQQNTRAILDSVEQVWKMENSIRLHFPDDHPVSFAFRSHVDAVGALYELVGERGTSDVPPTAAANERWHAHVRDVVRAQKALVEAGRVEVQAGPLGGWNRLARRRLHWPGVG